MSLRGFGFLGLCGVTGYAVCELLESMLLYRAATKIVVARVDGDLKERLGEPVGLGKWYNSSVGLRSGSHGQVADCVVGVAGQRRSGHVSLTMSRDAASDRGILFHHLFGDGVWRLDKASILVPDATKDGGSSP